MRNKYLNKNKIGDYFVSSIFVRTSQLVLLTEEWYKASIIVACRGHQFSFVASNCLNNNKFVQENLSVWKSWKASDAPSNN